jgi:hypothetical protein
MAFNQVIHQKEVKTQIRKNINRIADNIENKVYYSSGFVIERPYLNFINENSLTIFDRSVRNLIISEIWRAEQHAPGAGDCILSLLCTLFKDLPGIFEEEKSEKLILEYVKNEIESRFKSVDRLSEKDLEDYVDSIPDGMSKKIIKKLVSILEPEDTIYIEPTKSNQVLIKKTNSLSFKVDFDVDFLLGRSKVKAFDYKFIIIDGFIDSVGEIHHLLELSTNNQPIVMFCKGMREEVKNTILYNLKRGTINLLPISLTINEDNVNLLNDIAACHNSKIVSALNGDTISKAVKDELSAGIKIELDAKGFTFAELKNSSRLVQKNFLERKAQKLKDDDPNRKYIIERIKNLSSNKITISLPEFFDVEEKLILDKTLKFLKNSKKGIVKNINISNTFSERIYSIESLCIIYNKLISLSKTILSLGCIILEEKNE